MRSATAAAAAGPALERLAAVLLALSGLAMAACRDAPAASPLSDVLAVGAADDPAASFVGSWRLESWTTAEGAARCGAEARPAGQIMYSLDGHMSAQLGCLEPATAASGGGEETADGEDEEELTVEEARRQMTRRHFSYYGRYTVDLDARTVTHHVLGSVSAGWVGEDRIRSYSFETDDRLMLDAGGAKLVWLRNPPI
ncbi:MAG TPA: lipocalin-like domain-containing protein [Thermoanaerobaculia bacterium]|nr:lipocalin-like domain-containing protein [Thermoanaerobaculia bacterium]